MATSKNVESTSSSRSGSGEADGRVCSTISVIPKNSCRSIALPAMYTRAATSFSQSSFGSGSPVSTCVERPSTTSKVE